MTTLHKSRCRRCTRDYSQGLPQGVRRTWRPTGPASCSVSPADCDARTTWCRWPGRRTARQLARTCPSSSHAPDPGCPSADSRPGVTSRPVYILIFSIRQLLLLSTALLDKGLVTNNGMYAVATNITGDTGSDEFPHGTAGPKPETQMSAAVRAYFGASIPLRSMTGRPWVLSHNHAYMCYPSAIDSDTMHLEDAARK